MVTFDFIIQDEHPTEVEQTYLSSFYSRFFDIHAKFVANEFWIESPSQRLFLIKELFSIFNECIKYPPIQSFIESGQFSTISNPFLKGLFTIIRHILSHFPTSDCWDEIKFKKSWLTVFEKSSSIEKFMIKYKGFKHTIEYEIPYEPQKESMAINIPDKFFEDDIVFLNEIINEKKGVTFCISIMSLVLGYQLKVNNIFFKNKA